MRFWKRWAYLIILFVCGAVVLTATDSWAAVAKPGKDMGNWLAETFLGEGTQESLKEDGIVENTQGFSESLPFQASESGGVWETGALGESGESLSATEETGGEGTESGVPGTEGSVPGTESGELSSDGDTRERDPESSAQDPVETEPAYRDPADVVYTTVEDDYFSDAVFIGDSRMVGMHDYTELADTSTFYVSKGLTIFKLFTSEIVETPDGGTITVEEALTRTQFAKIYLEVGINEMGTGDLERFLNTYQEAVDHLRELQPDAIIYLQAIMKVTKERSDKGDYINNQGIEDRNAGIALIADNVHTFYLDVNPLVVDDTGGLNPDYTYDGVHLKGKHVAIWKDFLKEHAVVLD